MGTVLKSTKHRPCRPKIDVFYSKRTWNIGGENKIFYENFGFLERYLNPQTIAPVDPKLTYFTEKVHET